MQLIRAPRWHPRRARGSSLFPWDAPWIIHPCFAPWSFSTLGTSVKGDGNEGKPGALFPVRSCVRLVAHRRGFVRPLPLPYGFPTFPWEQAVGFPSTSHHFSMLVPSLPAFASQVSPAFPCAPLWGDQNDTKIKQRGKEGACNSSAAIRGLQNVAETLQEKGKKINKNQPRSHSAFLGGRSWGLRAAHLK